MRNKLKRFIHWLFRIKIREPYYVSFIYESLNGMTWTGDIEVVHAENPQSMVESVLLTWINITPNRRIEGKITAYIYSDPCKTLLIDTLMWVKTRKENFTYMQPDGI